MVRETDLPCSDCGADLVEREIDRRALSVPTASDRPIRVAECPDCDVRYFPEGALGSIVLRPGQDSAEGR